jgi:metallo-beta-lactamase class B
MLHRSAILLACGVLALAENKTPPQDAWNRPFPGHKIADHIYYAGTNELAAFLVTTPQGHILINQNFEESLPVMKAAIESVGFKVSDIKILLNSQSHWDHIGGLGAWQRLTGAKVMAMAGDVDVIESGGKRDFRFAGEHLYDPVKVDRTLRDGDEVKLGGITLVAHHTPGHTKGCTTWTMRTTDQGKPVNVVIFGSASINPGVRLVDRPSYPGIADDYARTFRVLKGLPCDVFLGAHGSHYGLKEKYEKLKSAPAGPNPFIDPAGYQARVAEAEAAYLKKLAAEKGK